MVSKWLIFTRPAESMWPGGFAVINRAVTAARSFLENEFGKTRSSKPKRQGVSSAAVLEDA
jgi:hypothetical protein